MQGSKKGLLDRRVFKTNISGTIEWQMSLVGSRGDVVTSVKNARPMRFLL